MLIALFIKATAQWLAWKGLINLALRAHRSSRKQIIQKFTESIAHQNTQYIFLGAQSGEGDISFFLLASVQLFSSFTLEFFGVSWSSLEFYGVSGSTQ